MFVESICGYWFERRVRAYSEKKCVLFLITIWAVLSRSFFFIFFSFTSALYEPFLLSLDGWMALAPQRDDWTTTTEKKILRKIKIKRRWLSPTFSLRAETHWETLFFFTCLSPAPTLRVLYFLRHSSIYTLHTYKYTFPYLSSWKGLIRILSFPPPLVSTSRIHCRLSQVYSFFLYLYSCTLLVPLSAVSWQPSKVRRLLCIDSCRVEAD